FHAMDERYLPVLERFAPDVFDRVSQVMQTKDLDVDVDLISRPTDMPQSAFTTIALYNPINRRMSVLSPFFWPNGDGTEAQLDDPEAYSFVHYLDGQQGDSVLPKILRSIRDTDDLDQTLRAVTGKGLDQWWRAWLRSLGS